MAAVLDREHLARYTMGDAALERELFGLFLTGAAEYIAALRRFPPGSAEFRRAAHSLKGAARGIGAFEVGDLAFACEQLPDDATRAALAVDRLAAAVEKVRQIVA